MRTLILGATSAIAGEIARLLAARGHRLYLLGGRSQEKLDALVASLAGAVVGAEVADFDDTEANADRVARAIERLGGLDWAIAAHGWLGDQLATERDYAEAEKVIRTNFLSMVSLLVPLARHFEAARGGHLAVLSSVAGERGRPRNFTYGASKAALNVFMQGLRSRLFAAGTAVHTFKLGPVDSPMTTGHRKHALFATPTRVAAGVVAGIEGGRQEAYVPGYWRAIMAVVRNVPEPLFQRFKFLAGR